MIKFKLSVICLITAYVTGCMPSEEEIIESPKINTNQVSKQTSTTNEKAIEEVKENIVQDIKEQEEVNKEQVIVKDANIAAYPEILHPSDGFLIGANRAEPWKAYQNYDQLPSRYGNDPFFLWSFKLGKKSEFLRP